MSNDASDHQPSDEGAIDADEVLRMGALIYAGKTITTANGTPPGPEAPAALDSARKDICPGNDMPTVVADALRDLQVAAVLFTLQLAEDHKHPRTLQQLEDKLIAALKRRGSAGTVHAPDDAAATLNLSDSALDYARQVIVAEETDDAPIGHSGVASYMKTFQVAATTFTTKLAMSEGLDSEIPRWVEENLIAMFAQESS